MMDKIFKFKQEKDVKRYYEKIGLKFNPFPLGGEPSKDQPYIIISEEVTNEITEFIDSVTASKKWQGLSLIGNNGTGKTRLLFLLESNTNNQLKYANAVYVNDPPASPVDFFSKIINSCDLDELTQIITNNVAHEDNLLNIIKSNLSTQSTFALKSTAVISDEKNLISDVSDYLKEKIPYDENIRKGYSALIVHYIISNTLRDLDIEVPSLENTAISDINTIKRFLAGQNVSNSLISKLGIKPVTVDNGFMEKTLFPSFLDYNRMADKSYVYALIDEFQFVIDNASKTKITSMLNMIIAVAQTNFNGFGMVLSCLPDSWNYAIRISNSFSERFNKQISMPSLTKKVAIKMVTEYLNYGRIERSEELNPFNEDAILKILEFNHYNPRDFLKNMGSILDTFVQDDKSEIIDLGFVRDFMKHHEHEAGLSLWF